MAKKPNMKPVASPAKPAAKVNADAQQRVARLWSRGEKLNAARFALAAGVDGFHGMSRQDRDDFNYLTNRAVSEGIIQ